MTTLTPSQVNFRMFHTYYIDDVKHNDACCKSKVLYNKVITAGNDPTITTNRRFSQVVNRSSKCYKRIPIAQAIADGKSNKKSNTNIQCPVHK
jgi:hypothetical protein